MICKNCGAEWPVLTTAPNPYFNNRSPSITSTTAVLSPATVLASGGEITFCPKCPMRADEAMRQGDRRGRDA